MAATKLYKRTENGVTTLISLKEGSAEMTHAQTDGKRHVREMFAGSTGARITYHDGRRVLLLKVDAPEEKAVENTPEPAAEEVAFEHCMPVAGGKVHTLAPGEPEGDAFPLCRTGGSTNRGTRYRVVNAPLTCATCMTYEQRRQAARAAQ
ncbi:hypothetical protein [Streptomyces altiplanensis]